MKREAATFPQAEIALQDHASVPAGNIERPKSKAYLSRVLLLVGLKAGSIEMEQHNVASAILRLSDGPLYTYIHRILPGGQNSTAQTCPIPTRSDAQHKRGLRI